MDESRICTQVVKNGAMCGKRRRSRRKRRNIYMCRARIRVRLTGRRVVPSNWKLFLWRDTEQQQLGNIAAGDKIFTGTERLAAVGRCFSYS